MNPIETNSEFEIAGNEDEDLIHVLTGYLRDLEAGQISEWTFLSQNRRIAHRLRPCLAALQLIHNVMRSARRVSAPAS